MTHGSRGRHATTLAAALAVLLLAFGVLATAAPPAAHPSESPLRPLMAVPSACASTPNLTATATPSSGIAPLTVAFSASIVGGCPPYYFEWEFGDVGEAEGHNVSHTFYGAGTYNVLLHASGQNNSTARYALQVEVLGGGGTFQVGVQAAPAQGPAPLAVTFWANVTGGNSSGSLTTNWDFGDGGQGSGSPVSHVYATPGTYAPAASVADGSGHQAAGSTTVVVGTPAGTPPANLSLQVDPSGGTPPLNTSIYAFSNGYASNDRLQVCFGDGSSCSDGPVGWNGHDPVLFAHQYDTSGSFTIYGSLTDPVGSVVAGATASVQVTASSPLVVQGDAHPLGGDVPLTVRFLAQVAGGTSPYTIQWRFGDGAAGSSVPGGSVDHTYSASGEYRATVMVTDSAGHTTGVAVGPISVQAPSALFSGLPPTVLGVPSGALIGIGLGAAVAAAVVIEMVLAGQHRRRLRKEGEQLVRGLEQGR